MTGSNSWIDWLTATSLNIIQIGFNEKHSPKAKVSTAYSEWTEKKPNAKHLLLLIKQGVYWTNLMIFSCFVPLDYL